MRLESLQDRSRKNARGAGASPATKRTRVRVCGKGQKEKHWIDFHKRTRVRTRTRVCGKAALGTEVGYRQGLRLYWS